MISNKDKLLLRIEDFLEEKRLSDGGYAEVGEEDVSELYEIFFGILEEKYQRDPDGDLPISVKITNHKTHVSVPIIPIERGPYQLDAVLSNLSVWMHMADIELKRRRMK